MAQTQRILCCDNIRTHFGLIWDTIWPPTANSQLLPLPQYNDWTADATRVVLAHFWSEKVHLWNLSSPSIWGHACLFSLRSDDVDNWASGWSKSFSPGPNFNVGQSPLEGSVRVLVDWNMVSNASIWCLVASRVELGWVETPSLWRFWHLQPIANFYYFPNIMTGSLKRPELFSLIFHVRTVIFGT